MGKMLRGCLMVIGLGVVGIVVLVVIMAASGSRGTSTGTNTSAGSSATRPAATVAAPTALPATASRPPAPTATTPPTTVPPTATPIAPTTVPPTAVPPAPAPPPPQAPRVVAFRSGGLGLPKAEWDRQKGPPGREAAGFTNYRNDSLSVSFQEGKVWHIERTWGERAAATMDYARNEAKGLLPTDARLVRTYTSRTGRTVDLYKSETLAAQFEGDVWTEGEPGNCIVIYRVAASNNRISTVVIGTGNNP